MNLDVGGLVYNITGYEGKLGMGTNTPAYLIDVVDAGDAIMRLKSDAIPRFSLHSTAGGSKHYSTSVQSDDWIFYDETGGGNANTPF